MNRKGFTLIELLVVISIIALLSSIVITATNIAKAKGNDARKMVEMNSVKTAVTSYYNDHGAMPPMYNCSDAEYQTSCVPSDQANPRTTLEIQNVGSEKTTSGAAFNATMSQLVAEHYLTSVPQAPGTNPYIYYDYGPGRPAGAMFGTVLEAGVKTSTGIGASCRPNGSGQVAMENNNIFLSLFKGVGSMFNYQLPVAYAQSSLPVSISSPTDGQIIWGNNTNISVAVGPTSALGDVTWNYYIDGALVHTNISSTNFGYLTDYYTVDTTVLSNSSHVFRVDVSSTGAGNVPANSGSNSVTITVDNSSNLRICHDMYGGEYACPLSTSNLCDNNSTTDYCVCNPY